MIRIIILLFLPLLIGCKMDRNGTTPEQAVPDEAYLKDRMMIEKVQRDAFNYIWLYGDPTSGMARERSTGSLTPLTTGGTGFGIAAIIAAVNHDWITREAAVERIQRMTTFLLEKTERTNLHGAFPHWIDPQTGKTVAFSPKDDGADLVETSFLLQGLLIARQWLVNTPSEIKLKADITKIWKEVEWNFFTRGENNGLYWHWSPQYGFAMNMKIQGFNECMVTYVLAISSPTHAISRETYDYWMEGNGYLDRSYNGYNIQGSMPYTGPLFFVHYSFIGLNPAKMADEHVTKGYQVRNTTQCLINRAYCLETAPQGNLYSPGYWGLTASDIQGGYTASAPDNDRATIAPTAALSSMPYVPQYSIQVLYNIYNNYRQQMWGPYGPYDAFSLRDHWFATSYLAIDQLPIACMIENYLTGLLWNLFMSDCDVARGLSLAGIKDPNLPEGFPSVVVTIIQAHGKYLVDAYDIRRHPYTGLYSIPYTVKIGGTVAFTLTDEFGQQLKHFKETARVGDNVLSFPQLTTPSDSVYTLTMHTGSKVYSIPVRMN